MHQTGAGWAIPLQKVGLRDSGEIGYYLVTGSKQGRNMWWVVGYVVVLAGATALMFTLTGEW